MERVAKTIVNNHIEVVRNSMEDVVSGIVSMADCICNSLQKGGKLLLCGNGGSAADCQHTAAEFVNRFRMERRPLPAVALTTDTSSITAIGNDYSFDEIFSKQVQAMALSGDVLLGISTSGNSANVIRAFEEAKRLGVTTLCLAGGNGGKMKGMCDIEFVVSSDDTPRIQEVHILALHILCELVEQKLCGQG
jgi:D-sedoheptulose 7-phosphate isomerase